LGAGEVAGIRRVAKHHVGPLAHHEAIYVCAIGRISGLHAMAARAVKTSPKQPYVAWP
jgi:hypothetical protein